MAGPGLFCWEGDTAWSCGEVAAEGTPWTLVGLSSVISSRQRYTSMGPLLLFRWSWRLSWGGGQSKAWGGAPISQPASPNLCGVQAGIHCKP